MDHLPYPENPILPPLRISYICQDVETYDGQGLKDFPARKGWILSPQWSARDSARAQSWLYFGLLIEMLGQSFNRDEFIDKARDGQQYVTTAKLPTLLRDKCQENSRPWRILIDDSQRGFLRGRPHVRLNKRLASALDLAEKQSDGQDTGDSLACAIVLSIKILIWSIDNALMTYLPTWRQSIHSAPRKSRLLRSRMLESGKCPYWTEVYLRTYSSAMINYLAATTSMDGHANHESCSTEQCIAHDIDNNRYATKHVNDNCLCDMTAPDIQKSTSIIENDGVPLIRFKQLPSGALTLDVVPAHYGLHYTAISHVWSGGLGNPTFNALPQCQLKNIREDNIAKKWFGLFGLKHAREKAHTDSRLYPYNDFPWNILSKTLLFHRQHAFDEVFWMDTLCIPPGLGKPLRQKAIARMNFTFSGADNVLVIDPGAPVHFGTKSLQTAVALAYCLFPLDDSMLDFPRDYLREENPLFRVQANETLWTDMSELEYEGFSFYGKMWPLVDQDPDYRPPIFFETEGGDVSELTNTWSQLSERSTTRRKDRLIILAVLLDLNAGEIMSLEVKEQMRAILRTRSALPLSFLFEPPTEPVVDNPKCRWIPLYPKGEISTYYGCMTRNRAQSHYQFQLSTIKALGFLLDDKDSGFTTFFIAPTVPYAFRAWVRIITREDIPTNCTRRATCIILSRMQDVSSNRTVGARFFVDNSSTEANSCTLIYDCPLIWTLVSPSQSLSPTEACPKLEPIVMPEATHVSLDCDLSEWYAPRISRAKSIGIRKRVGVQSLPYANYISNLVLTIWLLAAGIGMGTALRHDFPVGQVGLIGFLVGVPVAAFIRLTIFLFIEFPPLFEIVGERQYYRWATTFSGVDPDKFATVSDSKPLSYQYRPWWLAVLLISGAIALLVTGTRFPVMLWATVPGAMLLVETVLRFGLELLWLRTPLGDIGKRLLLRWLSGPIRL